MIFIDFYRIVLSTNRQICWGIMSYKVALLTVNPRQKSSIFSRVFVSQPSAEEELLVGRLFVLLELDAERAEDAKLADFLIAEAYRNYYENEAFLLRDRISNLKPEIMFEAAIAKLNNNLNEFIEQQKLRLSAGSLNAVVGIIYGNKLFFAHSGSGKALLLYRPKNKKGELLSDYSLVDITEKTNDPTQEIAQSNKFFTNVVAGLVPAHGYFFFANESLFEYLTKKQVTDIITTLPPVGAAEQMKNLLEQTNAFVPFYGFIIKNTTGEHDAYAAPASTIAVPGSLPVGAGRSSVRQLNLTQEKTEQLLSPSGMVNIKKWLGRLRPVSTGLKSYAQDKGRQLNIAGERLNAKRRSGQYGRKFIAFSVALFALLSQMFMQLIKLVSDPESRRETAAKTKRIAQRSAEASVKAIERFNRLNPKHKALLIIIGLCVLGLIANIIYTGISSRHKANQAQVAQVTTQFDQKENQLEAALLYNNREGAQQILNEMAALVEALPTRTTEDKTRQAEFNNRYESKLDSLYAIVRIKDEAKLLELDNDADSLISDSGVILALGANAKTVWRINPETKVAEASTNDIFPAPILGISADNRSIYLGGSSSILNYKADGQVFSNIPIDNAPENIDAAAVYNNRLYVAANGTIYRFNFDRPSNTFSSRIVWFKDPSALAKVTSIAIDGRVYLIENNSVTELSGGQRENLTLDPVSPALEEPTMVSVSPDKDFLYVLEPKNKRLLVYSKNGAYLAQYKGDGLDNLKSAAIDQENSAVYLLNGRGVYRIEANHFGE